MPTTMPGISITEAQKLLQVTDRIIKGFPEVDRVLGKAGRAETSTDPAPLSMLETLVILKPKSRVAQDGHLVFLLGAGMGQSSLSPHHAGPYLAGGTGQPDEPGAEASRRVERLDHADQGAHRHAHYRHPHARGAQDLRSGSEGIEEIGAQIEAICPRSKGRAASLRRSTGNGYFLDIDWNREELARYGLSMEEAQAVVANAIGGENVTTTIQGRERYPVNVRYLRDFRPDYGALGRVLVPVAGGQRQIPLSEARNDLHGQRALHDPRRGRPADRLCLRGSRGRDPGSYVKEASSAPERKAPACRPDMPSCGAASTRPCSGSGSG